MACKYICDGCGMEKPALTGGSGFYHPKDWFERGDKDGIQVACSRECIDIIAKKSGKTRCILPI